MDIEIRNLKKNMINSIPAECYIAIGNEYCIEKFWYDCTKISPDIARHKLVLVTPRVPEFSMEKTRSLIRDILKKFDIKRIIINDYGLLYAMSLELKEVQIVIGRTLSRNLKYCPWADRIMQQETKAVKRYIYSSNFAHQSKIAFWKKFGISGVEVCTEDLTEEFLAFMKSHNMNVFCHYDTVIASIGRVCHLKKMKYVQTHTRCNKVCTQKVTLKMRNIWSDYWNQNHPITKDIKENLPEFRCLGTAVYYICKPCQNKNVNIIYDYLFDEHAVSKLVYTQSEQQGEK